MKVENLKYVRENLVDLNMLEEIFLKYKIDKYDCRIILKMLNIYNDKNIKILFGLFI